MTSDEQDMLLAAVLSFDREERRARETMPAPSATAVDTEVPQ